jgi:hypothetical protein
MAISTATGGSTAATADMATAAVVDHTRTTFHASTISAVDGAPKLVVSGS